MIIQNLLHKLSLFLLLPIFIISHEYYYFLPPEGWTLAKLQPQPPSMKIVFVEKIDTEFPPLINLTTEKTTYSLKNYLLVAKKIHEEDPSTTEWRDLGKFSTQLGAGHLIQIDKHTPFGEARFMQLFLIQDQTAYVLTGRALKEEFAKYYEEFTKSFSSFNLIEDPQAVISSNSKK